VLFQRLGMREELVWVQALLVADDATPSGSEAGRVLVDSLDILQRSNRPRLLPQIYAMAGHLASRLHVLSRARLLVQQAVVFHSNLGDRYGLALAEFSLGQFAQLEWALPQAIEHYRRSLEIRHELRDRWGVSICLDHLGFVVREQGDFEQARRLHQESLAISREIGDPLGVAGSLDNLGLVAADEGDFVEATRYFQEGFELRRQVGKAWEMGFSAFHLGYSAFRQGEYETAAAWYVESLKNYARTPGRHEVELPLRGLGHTCLALGQVEHARRHFRSALRCSVRAEEPGDLLWHLADMAQFLAHCGRNERAAEVLSAILQHPWCIGALRQEVTQGLEELGPRLPPGTLLAAKESARGADLTQLAGALLRET
jgi:tetratricopeptide (TPR) repeat protein